MGQMVTVIESRSPRPGIVRYVLNRALTGMGHERYEAGVEVQGDRPSDELARRLLATEEVSGVSVNGNVVTVELARTEAEDLTGVIEGLYTHYLPGVEPPSDEELMAQAPG